MNDKKQEGETPYIDKLAEAQIGIPKEYLWIWKDGFEQAFHKYIDDLEAKILSLSNQESKKGFRK